MNRERLTLYVTKKEKRLLDELIKESELSASEFLRQLVKQAIKKQLHLEVMEL